MSNSPSTRKSIPAGLEFHSSWNPAEGLQAREDSTLEAKSYLKSDQLNDPSQGTTMVDDSKRAEWRWIFNRTSFWLSFALAWALLLGIIAAVFAGIEVKRSNRNSDCDKTISSAPQSTAGPTYASPTLSSQPTPQPLLPQSTFNCSALESGSFVSSIGPSAFQIRCDTDYVTHTLDFMGIQVYTFTDCINACASYNLRKNLHSSSLCYIATYNTRSDLSPQVLGGNCFLKSTRNIVMSSAINVSSAVLVQQNGK